jgi:uncharacterized protein HemX
MAEERVVETPAGTTTTRTSDQPSTVVVERGGGGTAIIAVVLLVLVAVGAWFLFSQNTAEVRKDNAITSAAQSVEGAADKAGAAVDRATK